MLLEDFFILPNPPVPARLIAGVCALIYLSSIMPALQSGINAAAVQHAMEDDFERKHHEMRSVAKDCLVVIDNLPEVAPEKFDKLAEKVYPIFHSAGQVARNPDGDVPRIFMARDDSGNTLGYAFVEYVSLEEAQKAVVALHNRALSKKHKFWVDTAGALERLQDVPDEFVPPQGLTVARRDRPDYKSWLLDPRGRDMFMIRHETETTIYWNDHVIKPQVDFTRDGWTEQHANWSPKGTYMFTVHIPGIKIWGRRETEDGLQWECVMRFEHQNVVQVAFSPCENYLLTFNATDPERDDKRNPRALVIWEVLTGKRKRGFLGPPRHMLGPEGQIPWPIFHWSHDDKYFARLQELPNASGGSAVGISIFETPGMGMLDKKSFRAPTGNIADFAWSPTSNVLAYSTPEEGDAPARVSLLEIPSRRELRQKALFSVSGIKLFWHPDGTFLCCQVDRMTKSKKGRFTNFELFRVKARDIPVEVLEYKEKDIVSQFRWEPSGYRFGVIHGHVDQPGRADVSFFDMQGASGELKHLCTLSKRVCNQIHWSPKGRFVLLATLGSQSGNLEFYDVNECDKNGEPCLIGADEHFLCSDVQWDPSGRFVATAVTCWRNRNDNGYIIWTLYGKELFRANVDMLYQFAWRPRPSSLLTSSEEKTARKNLKILREKYEREDKDLKDSVSSGNAARRKELRDAYRKLMEEGNARVEAEAPLRLEAIGRKMERSDDEYEKIVETVETILSMKTEIDWQTKLLTSDDERD